VARYADAPEPLLASQWTALHAPNADPVRRLFVAVLENAVMSYRYAQRRHKVERLEQERAWFVSEDRSHLFTFVRICEQLELNATRIRRGVLVVEPTVSVRSHGRLCGTAPRKVG